MPRKCGTKFKAFFTKCYLIYWDLVWKLFKIILCRCLKLLPAVSIMAWLVRPACLGWSPALLLVPDCTPWAIRWWLREAAGAWGCEFWMQELFSSFLLWLSNLKTRSLTHYLKSAQDLFPLKMITKKLIHRWKIMVEKEIKRQPPLRLPKPENTQCTIRETIKRLWKPAVGIWQRRWRR